MNHALTPSQDRQVQLQSDTYETGRRDERQSAGGELRRLLWEESCHARDAGERRAYSRVMALLAKWEKGKK